MQKQKRILAGILALVMCAGLTACGKEEVSVTSGLELTFSGVNGYGTASLDESYDWVEDALDLCEDLDDEEEMELGIDL